jgi:hypothetical protein
MAWTLSMESSGGGGAEESITDAEKEVLMLFFVPWAFFFFLFFLTSPLSVLVSVYDMLALAKSAAFLSLKPSQSFAILLLRLTLVTSLTIFFCFLGTGVVAII